METEAYKVSVIVPVYNVSDYIEESILSICKQKFEGFQIILVNDGTKDDSIKISEDILKKYAVNYKIINQENKGLPSARNTGFKEAEGKYVVFVDSDDIIDEKFLSTLYSACEDNGVDAAFAEYEVTHMDNRKGTNNSHFEIEVLTRDELLYVNMLRTTKIHLCAILIKKAFLLENDLWFDESLRYGEEVDFTWRMYPKLKNIVHIKAKMYKYLVRQNSLMTNQNIDRVLSLLVVVRKDINEWFKKYPKDSKKYKWVESKIYFEKMHAFAQQAKYSTFLDLIKQTEYKQRMKELYDFPDAKIRILSRALRICPFCFWILFRLHKL